MTWETIEDYLLKVARAAALENGSLALVRQEHVITKDNWQWGYLKPDEGYSSKINLYVIKHIPTGRTVTSFGLHQFPSYCALCASTQAFVEPVFRRKGINKLSNEFRQKIAAKEGYAALVCTDVLTNEAERRTLMNQGFVDLFQVHNHRTGNDVVMSVKRLE